MSVESSEPKLSSADEGLIVAAWATAFLLPLIGLICGIILTSKGQTGHGVGAMVVSVMMCAIWLAIVGALAS